MYLDENGNETKFSNKNRLYEKVDYYAKCQMRLIALAYKTKKDNLNIIPENMTLVAIVALKDLKDAKLSIGEMDTDEQIAFIRRWIMKDGSIVTNPGGRHLEVDREYYDADNTVRLIKFQREDAKDIAFVNFSTALSTALKFTAQPYTANRSSPFVSSARRMSHIRRRCRF